MGHFLYHVITTVHKSLMTDNDIYRLKLSTNDAICFITVLFFIIYPDTKICMFAITIYTRNIVLAVCDVL